MISRLTRWARALVGLFAVLTLAFAPTADAGVRGHFKGRSDHSAGPGPLVGKANGPTRFVLGVWLPSPGDGAKWAGRHINTAFAGMDDDNGWAAGTWRADMLANGLKLVVSSYHNGATVDCRILGIHTDGTSRPVCPNTIAADNADANIIATNIRDEPEISVPSAYFQNEINDYAAKGGTRPVYLNMTAHAASYEHTTPDNLQPWLVLTGVHWRAQDAYIPQGDWLYWAGNITAVYCPTLGDYAPYAENDNFSTLLGKATDQLLGHHQYACNNVTAANSAMEFIATGRVNQFQSPPGSGIYVDAPRQTPTYYSLQFWSAVIHGASGITNFTHFFSADPPFVLVDDTAPDIVAQIAVEYGRITTLETQPGGNVLMDAVNGGRRAGSTLHRAPKATGGDVGGTYWTDINYDFMQQSPVGNEMPKWFEALEVPVGGETYWIVLNLSFNEIKSLTYAPAGVANDNYAPGQVKCFKASNPTVDLCAAA